MENYIIGVMGKKGSGKTELVKKYIPKLKRAIIIDPMHEYHESTIVYNWRDLVGFIDEFKDLEFRVIFRPADFEDVNMFFVIANNVNRYTLVVEEVENWCDSRRIHPDFEKMISFGRHGERNIIWISRSPFEINRDLTRQTDVLISFRQTEPVDLKYLANYNFNKDLKTLDQYEYAFWTDGKLQIPIRGNGNV